MTTGLCIRGSSLAIGLLLMLAALPARAVPVDWDEAFLMQASNGIVDPVVLFGFNPQPDPPGTSTRIDLGNSTAPTLVVPGQSNPQLFSFYLAMTCDGSVKCALDLPDLPSGNFDRYEFIASSPAAGDLIVRLDFATSSLGIPDGTSVVSFNPQPDPPGDFGPDGAMGLEFAFTSLSDAMVSLSIRDAAGTPFTFAAVSVPEPTTLSLLALGLLGLGAMGRRQRLAPNGGRRG